MARGVEYPLRITGRGGLAINESNVATVFGLELLPSSSANPFDDRDAVSSKDYAFDTVDDATEGSIRRRVTEVAARLERAGRARLTSVDLDHAIAQATGQLRVVVIWDNLERGVSQTTVVDVSGGSSG